MHQRPAWDVWFLAIAAVVGERSDCRRDQVGAVIVDTSHRLVSAGYIGVTPGTPGCLAGACERGLKSLTELPPGTGTYDNCISQHAEVNAITNADPQRLPGATLYVTRRPCAWCTKVIKSAGIKHMIWPDTPPYAGRHRAA